MHIFNQIPIEYPYGITVIILQNQKLKFSVFQ